MAFACDKHRKEPVIGYCACPGCEVEMLRAENERLRERAEKYAVIERVMEMLKCDEREGGIWTACTLLLIGSAHGMNSARSTVDQEGVDIAGDNIGDWRVIVERLSATAKEGNAKP